jgi:predicted nucleic acid-binding protein
LLQTKNLADSPFLQIRQNRTNAEIETRLRHVEPYTNRIWHPGWRRFDLNEDAALLYAEIRADLKKRGAMIGANDLFIAAHARALGLTLVTNNTAEFERVKGLDLEDWTMPTRCRR